MLQSIKCWYEKLQIRVHIFVLVENEKLKEERDKYNKESSDLKDQCQTLNKELERSRVENTELKEQIQNITIGQEMTNDARDGTTSENRTLSQQGGGLK